MATAIIENHQLGNVKLEEPMAAETTAEQPSCPLESLQHHGLECKLCTWYTVLGPVEIIQRECPVVAAVVNTLLDAAPGSALPVASCDSKPLHQGVQRGALQSKADSGAIFSPYDALGLAEQVDDVPALNVRKRKRSR